MSTGPLLKGCSIWGRGRLRVLRGQVGGIMGRQAGCVCGVEIGWGRRMGGCDGRPGGGPGGHCRVVCRVGQRAEVAPAWLAGGG